MYLSTRVRLAEPLAIEGGLRYDNLSHSSDQLWSPRASLLYTLTKSTRLRAGWGHYYQSQGINELNIQFGDGDFYPAQRAEHFVAGLEHLFGNGLDLRVEGYYKRMTDLRNAYYTFSDIDEFFPESRDDLIEVVFNEGSSKGAEFFLKYDRGRKFSWWLSYVLADASNEVTDIIYEGRLIKKFCAQPRPWDQRHTVNLDANYRLSKSWQFNIAWQYRTGWPATDFVVRRIIRDDGTFAYYHDHGVYNDSRYPNYQRLDIRFNKHWFTVKGKITSFLHVINVYNHENINAYDHDILFESPERFSAAKAPETWFGILPFAGFSWEF